MPMSIPKAIEILELRVASPFTRANPDTAGAMQLGIEALKAYDKALQNGWYPPGFHLPGETED